MPRHISFLILALTALLLLSLVAAPVAVGQDILLPAPVAQDGAASSEPELLDDGLVPGQTPHAPASGVCSPCDEEHWIVSVRHCDRECRCGHCCSFEYGRSDWNGCCTPATEADFHNWLRPGIPICIMVHGSFVPDETMAIDCRNTFRWLRQAAPHMPVQVVFFSWESDGIFTLDPASAHTSAIPGIDVAILGRRAEHNGLRLAKLVHQLPSESPLCLIGHSHGARMVASALHVLGGGQTPEGISLPGGARQRIRAVLVAAAIDHDWFCPGQRFECGLYSTECLLNMQSQFDWALAVYPLRRLFSRRSLGQAGFTERDLQRLGPLSQRVVELDVTSAIRFGHIWPAYYEQPQLATVLIPWVYYTQ